MEELQETNLQGLAKYIMTKKGMVCDQRQRQDEKVKKKGTA